MLAERVTCYYSPVAKALCRRDHTRTVPGGTDNVSAFFFFFSSRRRHTRFKCDWSSDVCSSDLILLDRAFQAEYSGIARRVCHYSGPQARGRTTSHYAEGGGSSVPAGLPARPRRRSEERRVGKECRSRWSPYH